MTRRPLDPMIEAKIRNVENYRVQDAMREIAHNLMQLDGTVPEPQQLLDVARGHIRARRNFNRMRK